MALESLTLWIRSYDSAATFINGLTAPKLTRLIFGGGPVPCGREDGSERVGVLFPRLAVVGDAHVRIDADILCAQVPALPANRVPFLHRAQFGNPFSTGIEEENRA